MRPPTLTERVVDCSGGDEISEESGFQRKAEALLGLLGQEKSARTLIFCNKIPTCRKVLHCSPELSLIKAQGGCDVVRPHAFSIHCAANVHAIDGLRSLACATHMLPTRARAASSKPWPPIKRMEPVLRRLRIS